MGIDSTRQEVIHCTFNGFHIESPSWVFANSGTRFGKFPDPGGTVICFMESFR